jgi:hypothetical protein
MHQIFPGDGELRHRGVMTEVGKMANYIVMDFGSGLFAAHDDGFAAQRLPQNRR